MTTLLGTDGQHYEIPDENAQEALASGKFTLPPSTPQAMPEPDVATAAPPAAGTGSDVASEAEGERAAYEAEHPLTDEQRLQAEKEEHARTDKPDMFGVPLIGEDGKLYAIPDAQIPDALATGKFRVSTLEERNADAGEKARAAEVERAGEIGLKPYVGGAVDATLGKFGEHFPAFQLAEAASSPEFKEAAEKASDTTSEKYPIASGVGAVGGEVGTALLGGEAAGAITKAAGLTGIARAAAEGAVYSAEPVAKAIINKDPAGSAEALALGIGLNVALHGAFGAIEKLPGAAAEATEAVQGALRDKFVPEYTEQEAGNAFGRAIGLTTKQIADNRPEIVPLLKASKIASSDTLEQAVAKIQKLEESGPAIGKAIKLLDSLDEKAPILEQNLTNAQAELRNLIPKEALDREAVETSIDSAKNELKRISLAKKPNPFRLSLAKNQLETAERTLLDLPEVSPLAQQALKTIGPIIDQVEAAAAKGTFAETQALKKFVGDQTNFADNKFANTLRRQAYGIVADNVARAEDAAAEKIGSAHVVEGLRQQRGAYALYKLFGDAADKVAARQGPEPLSHLLGGPSTGSGHMLPHFVLGAFGLPSGVNAALAIAGVPQMVKSYVAKQQLRGAIAKLLNESTTPATNTIVHALERQKLQLSDSVKGFFGALGTEEALKPLDTSGGLRAFVPDANGRSHAQQIAALQRLVVQSQTDPAATAARLDHVVAPLRAEGLDEVAQAYTDHQLRLLKVIQAILPKDPSLLAHAHPFAAKVDAEDIEPATKERLQRGLTIAADPTALLHLIKNNQITQGDVAIAAAVNPSTLQKLRDELVQEGLKAKPDLSYQQRLSIGILLGQHIDQSTEQIPQLQSVYAGQTAPSAPAHPRSGKLPAGASKSLASSSLTLSQQSHAR
jgi:hypothetical protein